LAYETEVRLARNIADFTNERSDVRQYVSDYLSNPEKQKATTLHLLRQNENKPYSSFKTTAAIESVNSAIGFVFDDKKGIIADVQLFNYVDDLDDVELPKNDDDDDIVLSGYCEIKEDKAHSAKIWKFLKGRDCKYYGFVKEYDTHLGKLLIFDPDHDEPSFMYEGNFFSEGNAYTVGGTGQLWILKKLVTDGGDVFADIGDRVKGSFTFDGEIEDEKWCCSKQLESTASVSRWKTLLAEFGAKISGPK